MCSNSSNKSGPILAIFGTEYRYYSSSIDTYNLLELFGNIMGFGF